MRNSKPIAIFASILIAILVLIVPLEIGTNAHMALAITILMAALWICEAMPLHVTALLGTVLYILLAGIDAKEAFSSYFNPTIALFFGGFVLALAMQKHGLDKKIVSGLMRWFGTEPRIFVLGLMIATAFISFWISNTATAAIMMPIAIFALSSSGAKAGKSEFGKAAVIGIAFAATIGGVGTIVGTAPNAITVGELAARGILVSFFDWAIRGLPVVLILIPAAWLILIMSFRIDIRGIKLPKMADKGWNNEQIRLAVIGLISIGLWMTSSIHKIPDGVVAVIAVILIYLADLVEGDDISKIDWGILLLLGGSMCMGAAIASSGLSSYLGGVLSNAVLGQSNVAIIFLVALFAVIVTSFMSNTSTAALVVPIVASLSRGLGPGIGSLAMVAGISSSFNYITPFGTPPSAMAYSSGYIKVWDMMKVGIPLTLAGIIVITALAQWVW